MQLSKLCTVAFLGSNLLSAISVTDLEQVGSYFLVTVLRHLLTADKLARRSAITEHRTTILPTRDLKSRDEVLTEGLQCRKASPASPNVFQ